MKLKHYSTEISFLWFIFIFFLFITAKVQAQDNNSISGFIFAANRQPLQQVQVELLDDYNRTIARVVTEGSGRYNFYRLPQGRYSIRVRPLGTNYEEQTIEVEIVNITRASSNRTSTVSGIENKQQDFYLRLKRDANNSPTINAVVFAQEIPKSAQKSYEKAISDLNDKKVEKAIIELNTAIEIFPNYFLALEKLGQEYINQQKYDKARDILVKAVEINSKSFESQYALSFALFKLKTYPEALTAIKKAVDLNSSSVNGLFLLGVNLKQAGKYTEAVESLEKAKKLSLSSMPEIHWQLALIYTNNFKKYSTAADELELFLKANPKYEEAEKVKVLIKSLREKSKS